MAAVPRCFTSQQKVTSLTVGEAGSGDGVLWWSAACFSGMLVLTFKWLEFPPKEALQYESVLHFNTDSGGSFAAVKC